MGVIVLIWPLVIIVTLLLYFLTVVSLPFSATAATFFLFTLIAFWSRLPGVGIPAPLLILYLADVIDLLGMIVAINIGPIYGVFLTIFTCIVGRACGAFTPWIIPLRESIALSICCLAAPYIHAATGDLFVTMMIFQALRFAIVALMIVVGFAEELPVFMARLVVGGTGAFMINAFYVKLFGDFFDNLLQSGASFSWPLFFFSSIVIFGTYGIMYFFSDKNSSYNLKALKRKVREYFSGERKPKVKKKTRQENVEAEETVQHLDKKRVKIESLKQAIKANNEKGVGNIETIGKGCPACDADVRGNNTKGFYCSNCDTIHRRRHLQLRRF